jgi:hypothetical protein
MTRLYKWLLADDRTPIQNVKWAAKVGEWTQKETPVICKSGWHGMREQDVLSHLPGVGAKLYVVETRGEMVHGSDKFAAESMRLVRILGVTTEQNLRLFMCDVAEDVLPIYEAWAPGDDRRARKSIEAGRAFALDPTNETKAARAAEAAWAARAAWAAWAAEAAEAAGAARAARAAWAAWAAGAAGAAEAAWAAWGARAAGIAGAARAAEAAWGAEAARQDAMNKYSNWLVCRIESDI